MPVPMQEYQDLYIKTAREKIDAMATCLADINNNARPDALKELHRYVHSLKSQSLVMGYSSIGTLARTLEMGIKHVLDAHSSLTQKELNFLHEMLAAMKTSVQSLAKGAHETNFEKEIQKAHELFGVTGDDSTNLNKN